MQTRPQRDGLHRRLLRHAALLAVAPLAAPEDETCTASASTSRKSRCRPWPWVRLSRTPETGRHARDYYGGSAPHHRPSADDAPSLPHAGSRAGGDPSAVPTFTDRSVDG